VKEFPNGYFRLAWAPFQKKDSDDDHDDHDPVTEKWLKVRLLCFQLFLVLSCHVGNLKNDPVESSTTNMPLGIHTPRQIKKWKYFSQRSTEKGTAIETVALLPVKGMEYVVYILGLPSDLVYSFWAVLRIVCSCWVSDHITVYPLPQLKSKLSFWEDLTQYFITQVSHLTLISIMKVIHYNDDDEKEWKGSWIYVLLFTMQWMCVWHFLSANVILINMHAFFTATQESIIIQKLTFLSAKE